MERTTLWSIGLQFEFTKIGKLVIVQATGTLSTPIGWDGLDLPERIPDGFTPKYSYTGQIIVQTAGSGTWGFGSDGHMKAQPINGSPVQAGQVACVNATYFIN